MKKGIPLEQIYPDIVKGVYLLHPDNGYHYFSKCSPEKKIKKFIENLYGLGLKLFQMIQTYLLKQDFLDLQKEIHILN